MGPGNDWVNIYPNSGEAIDVHTLAKLDGGPGIDTLSFGVSGYGEEGATLTLTTRGATNFENLGGSAVSESLQGDSLDNVISSKTNFTSSLGIVISLLGVVTTLGSLYIYSKESPLLPFSSVITTLVSLNESIGLLNKDRQPKNSFKS